MPTATSSPSEAADRHLQEAVKDSHYLLAYFSRTRVNIPADKRDEFTKAIRTLSTFRLPGAVSTPPEAGSPDADGAPAGAAPPDADAIAAFWNAFIFLSDLAYPATIESIRYYFRFYYNSHKQPKAKDGKRQRRPGQGLIFRKGQAGFEFLTFLALFMTIGLSLVAYIGSRALLDYDADYAHWSQVQMLVRYLDEGGKPNFAAEATAASRRLVVTFPTAAAPGQDRTGTPIRQNASLGSDPTAVDPLPDLSIDVPIARVARISKLLIDADLGDKPTTSFGYACRRLLALFAAARGSRPSDPVPPGALSLDECLRLMASVKPHVLTVADDLALTFSSMSAERETLDQVLRLVVFPVRLFDAAVLRPSTWAYHRMLHLAAGAASDAQAAPSATAPPSSAAAQTAPPDVDDFVHNPAEAFDLFVLMQQRHAPIPIILPIPSVKIVGGVFDARLAVAVANTYLLTLAFGFLGACVRVLREINARLEDFTLAPSLFARYRARILLGMVAGPTIGLFFDQDGHLLSFATSTTSVPNLSTQLSALAIAFVAGFSIEIVFAILDRSIRIIQEFAGVNGTHPVTTR